MKCTVRLTVIVTIDAISPKQAEQTALTDWRKVVNYHGATCTSAKADQVHP